MADFIEPAGPPPIAQIIWSLYAGEQMKFFKTALAANHENLGGLLLKLCYSCDIQRVAVLAVLP